MPLQHRTTLALGKNYIPPPKQLKWNAVKMEFDSFVRRLRIRANFQNSKTNAIKGIYFPNTKYQPPTGPPPLETYINRTSNLLREEFDKLLTHMKGPAQNTDVQSLEKYLLLHDLCTVPADKGLGLCVIHKDAYSKHMIDSLSNSFREVTEATANTAIYSTYAEIVRLARALLRKNPDKPPENLFKYLTKEATPANSTTKKPYLIYKVHKLQKLNTTAFPPTRLIVPCHNGITRAASRYLDQILQPLVTDNIKYLLPDSKTLLKSLETTSFPKKCSLSTSDIVALYPSIPIDAGIRAMSTFIQDKIEDEEDRRNIILLFTLIMRNNYVVFKGIYYLQQVGTCMGTPCAPIFANVFVFEHEKHLMNRYINDGSLYIYRRLIDDVFAIFNNDDTSKRFWREYNQIDPSIQTTSEQQPGLDYLDLHVYKGHRFNTTISSFARLDVRLHQKIHNRYAYLPFYSYHPRSTINSWMTSELQRAVRAFSDYKAYVSYCQTFYNRLRQRGYPHKTIVAAFNKVSFSKRRKYIFGHRTGTKPARTIICMEYNPTVNKLQIGSIVKENWEVLAAQSTPDWATPPLIAYKNAQNLMGILSKNIPK